MTIFSEAAERSAIYQLLARSFSYAGTADSPFGISGAAYNQMFDRAVNPKACSLREASYTQEDHSALFEELMRFYSYFGLARQDMAELPDHLSVELEFMHFLAFLEAQQGEDGPAVESLQRAQHDFLNRHLARLVEGVHARIENPDHGGAALVASCHNFIQSELARASAGTTLRN